MTEAIPRKSHTTEWILAGVVVPLLYVLSCAPMTRWTEDPALPDRWPEWVFTFYKPVAWLHDNTPLGTPLDAYREWWMKR